jgi:hypothetical protein
VVALAGVDAVAVRKSSVSYLTGRDSVSDRFLARRKGKGAEDCGGETASWGDRPPQQNVEETRCLTTRT